MEDFSKLEKELNISFQNKDLLIQAFCHRSYLNEHPNFEPGHNERLEFLGDAVLELVISQYLFAKYPKKDEGLLTSWRAALVNSKMLSLIAQELGFDRFLLLSKGERRETNKARQDISADAFEAFIGALYLDQGYKVCKDFLEKHLVIKLPDILENEEFIDAKSRFQEIAQEKEKTTPHYEIVREWGPDHAKHFVSGVYLEDELVAQGDGVSKQEAEESAAKAGIEAKGWE